MIKFDSVEQIRSIVTDNAARIAELGNWPEWKRPHAVESLVSRIPEGAKSAPGFDAGIAWCLDLIPRDKQKLAAALHGDYTPVAVEQVRREAETMDPDSETTWWLAACSLCEEGAMTEALFFSQLRSFDALCNDDDLRVRAARDTLAMMTKDFALVDEQNRPMSGPVHGSRQFVKAWSFPELSAALEVVRKHLG